MLQGMKISMSLRQKIILAVILTILLFGSLAVASVFYYAKSSLVEKKKDELKNLISAQSLEISQILRNSVELAGTIASQDFVRSYLEGAHNPQDEKVLADFNQYNISGKYSAIYLLDLAGNALVSTDPSFVGENYSFRNYYKSAVLGNPAVGYAMGVTSKKLGYYFAQPVKDGEGKVVGIVVAKMDPGAIDQALGRIDPLGGKVMFSDDLGVIIYSNNQDRLYKTLGPLTQEKSTLLKEEKRYEDIAVVPLQYGLVQENLFSSQEAKVVELFDQEENEEELLAVKQVSTYPFYLVLEEGYEEYVGSAVTVSFLLGFFILLAVIGAGIILSYSINKFLKPLDLIQGAALRISQGNLKTRIDESLLSGELQRLANAFNVMMASVVKSREEVDRKVEEQVAEIKEKSQEIENQQKATINILEDVNNSQEELKLRYRELDIIKSLTQKLGVTLEEQAVMKNIASALQELFPEAVVSHLIFPIFVEHSEKTPNTTYVHSLKKIGPRYLEQINKQILQGLDNFPLYLKKKDYWGNWIKRGFVAEVSGNLQGGDQDGIPLSHLNIPIVVPNALAGLINLSSESADLLSNQKNADVVKVVVENAVQTVERLKVLVTSEHSRLQDLVESMRSAVVMFDENKRMAVVNSSAKKIFNIANTSFSLDDFFAAARKGKISGGSDVKTLYADALAKNKTQKIDSLELDRRFYEVVITPVNDFQKEVSGGVIILHDITHLKEIDRMKTEFVSVASHQLRTPLTAINWYVEMLQSGDAGKLNKDQKNYLEEIYKGSVRMVRLVNELLNVSRLETGRLKVSPKLIYLDKLIEDVIHELEAVAKKRKCPIVFHKAEKRLPKIAVDETLMRQVIHNFITNALRYSPVGEGEVAVTLAEKEDSYLISVADQGIGIPKEAQGKIFQKFFRADNARKMEGEGSGIGLYIVKMIMEASSGKIWFESPTLKRKGANGKTESYGTTFYASLPKKGMVAHEGEKGLAI